MDTILPSEISRLVLGFLKEEECFEAAKVFLETCPNLQEIRNVAAKGLRYSTKVHSFTLTCILQKFFAIYGLVQQRSDDSNNGKQSDLLGELERILQGSKAQRFYVNINVPSQTTGGSPIITGSSKKRRYSGTHDKERIKRPNTTNLSTEKLSDDNVPVYFESADLPDGQQKLSRVDPLELSSCTFQLPGQNTSQTKSVDVAISPISLSPKKLDEDEEKKDKSSTGVGTDEFIQYTSAEVQTTPDLIESESESDIINEIKVHFPETLKNELLKCPEFHKNLAANINKHTATLPADLSLKELSFSSDMLGTDSNFLEINKFYDSTVTTAKSDPRIESFLHDLLNEEENRLEENAGRISCERPVTDVLPITPCTNLDNKPFESNELAACEKKIQNTDKLVSSELDKFNAAAVQSIIDANNLSNNIAKEEKGDENVNLVNETPEITVTPVEVNESPAKVDEQKPQEVKIDEKKTQQGPTVKEKKPTKYKKKAEPELIIPPTIPTLVVCPPSRVINSTFSTPAFVAGNIPLAPVSSYIPIAPKIAEPQIYLKTVHVPRELPVVTKIEDVHIPLNEVFKVSGSKSKQSRQKKASEKQEKAVEISKIPSDDCVVVLPEEAEMRVDDKPGEAITLYNENSSLAIIEGASMPSVQLDDSISISGTGLSPFLKFDKKKVPLPEEEVSVNASSKENADDNKTTDRSSSVLIKRTPKSILKSRSKNNRLSLSTPRRRSHIRALDFSTPVKGLTTSRRMSDSESTVNLSPKLSKPTCRASLFQSPMNKSHNSIRKQKTPIKILKINKIPIATHSPLPKLKGGWDKVTGFGMIIDEGNSSSPKGKCKKNTVTANPPAKMKTWDSDLRTSLKIEEELKPKRARVVKPRIKTVRTAGARKQLSRKKDENEDECKDQTEGNSNEVKEDVEKIDGDSDGEMKQNVSDPPAEDVQSRSETLMVTDKKGVTKKYAQLTTLSTSVSRDCESDKDKSNLDISKEKSSSLLKIYQSLPEINLETPRKPGLFDLPPTPRVLSPNSSTTPFIQVNENSEKLQCFINTPEFPPTPSINVTPKASEENVSEDAKKNFPTYYQPDKNLMDKGGEKIEIEMKKEEKIAVISTDTLEINKSVITEFQVITDNLPKDKMIKELNISSKESSQLVDGSGMNKSGETSGVTHSSFESHSQSSSCSQVYRGDKDSSSSSSSSSSCSSCSSSSSDSDCSSQNDESIMSRSSKKKQSKPVKKLEKSPAENPVPKMDDNLPNERLAEEKHLEKAEEPQPVVLEIEKQPEQVVKQIQDPLTKNETSPVKVFPVDVQNDDKDLETPAKNETLLPEAGISETPFSSKSGTEIPTKFSTKMSAMSAENAKSKVTDNPQVISESLVVSPPKKKTKAPRVSLLDNSMASSYKDEMDEKRLRVQQKISNPKLPPKIRQPAAKGRGRKPIDTTNKPSTSKCKEESVDVKKKNLSGTRRSARNASKIFKSLTEKSLSQPEKAKPIKKPPPKASKKVDNLKKAEVQPVVTLSTDEEDEIERKLKNLGEGVDAEPKKLSKCSNETNLEKKISPKVDVRKILDDSIKVDQEIEVEEKSLQPAEPSGTTNAKGICKIKVDNVKRDLFSDEELEGKAEAKDNKTPESPKQELLESLQLVPANKSDLIEPEKRSKPNDKEFFFVYDESNCSKKENRSPLDPNFRLKIIEPEFEIELSYTPHEQIFELMPSAKSKVISNKATKTSAAIRRKTSICSTSSQIKILDSQPLATSSPVQLDLVAKIPARIIASNSQAALTKQKTDPQSSKESDKKSTSRKRKDANPDQNEPAEKKARDHIPIAEKIEKVLNTLHPTSVNI